MALEAVVECHCHLNCFSIAIDPKALPLKSSICHCDSCRHTTGQLFATWAVIPTPLSVTAVDDTGLVKYTVSTCDRFFCRRCGASMINVDRAGDQVEWEVATGVLKLKDPNGLEGKLRRVQLWIDDVKGDGGAVGWINGGTLKGMDRHWRERGSEMVSDDAVASFMAPQPAAEGQPERLVAQCRCQAVRFEVVMPGEEEGEGSGNIRSCLCACTSCRVVTGFEITAWTSVPLKNAIAGSSVAKFVSETTRLNFYESSPGIDRYFCATCGATVFYHDKSRPTIDIATGLLESIKPGCVRAEALLHWRLSPEAQSTSPSADNQSYVGFPEDAIDAAFVKNVSEGMKRWQAEA
jgi:hypothetical protein